MPDLSTNQHIAQARSLSHNFLPDLPRTDFPSLLSDYSTSKAPFLTIIDAQNESTRLTFEEFYHHTRAVAAFLGKRGLRRGQRVAVWSPSHSQTVVQYFACWLLGIAIVPINGARGDGFVASQLQQSRADLLFVRGRTAHRFQKMKSGHPSIKNIDVVKCNESMQTISGDISRLTLPNDDLSQAEALISYAPDADGEPLGAVLTQQNLLEAARSIKQWNKIDEQYGIGTPLGLHHRDAIVAGLITPFYVGASAFVLADFEPERWIDVLARWPITIGVCSAAMISAIYEAGLSSLPEKAQLRHLLCGDVPPVATLKKWVQQLPVRIVGGWSLPETTSFCAILPLDLSNNDSNHWLTGEKWRGIGVDLPPCEMQVQNENGEAVNDGEIGELVVRGRTIMLRYESDPERTAQALAGGWLHTGRKAFVKGDDMKRHFYFVADGEPNEPKSHNSDSSFG